MDDYRTLFGLDPRTTIWFVAQLHLMFAGFVLGVPAFAVVVEWVGARTGDARFDRLARDFVRLLSAAFATTAALGGLLLLALLVLYPTFTTRLAGIFGSSFLLYGLLFFGEAFALYYYHYSWDRLASPRLRSRLLARVGWSACLVAVVGGAVLWFASMPDLAGTRRIGRVEADRAVAWADQLGPWLARGIEDGAEPEEYLAGPIDQLVAWETSRAPGDAAVEERVRRTAARLLDAAEEVAATRGTLPGDATGLLTARAETLAADLRAEADVRAARLSETRWRRLLAVGLVALLLSCLAAAATSAKALHIWFGVLLNLLGTALLLVANSWVSYTMTPTGVHEVTGEFVGTTWQATANPLWNPLNLHRLLANVVLGGFVAAAYAAVRSLLAGTAEDRARYDWMGYVGNFVGMAALLPLPFAGYYLGREVYGYSPIMGNDMMGGAFSWSFILQALLVGMLFLGANYYLWVGMQRIPGANRYRRWIPWNTLVLVVCFGIWMTPHNLPLDAAERAMMAGESFHPLLKYFGLMPAKNAAVNLIIVSTFFSFLMYRRANRAGPRPFHAQGLTPRIVLLSTLAAAIAGLLWYAQVVWRLDPASIGAEQQARWIFAGGALALVAQAAACLVAVLMTLAGRGRGGQVVVLASTVLLASLFLGIWGFAAMTVASGFMTSLAVCQTLIVLSCLVLATAIDLLLFRGAREIGRIRWGAIPRRASYALIWNCVAVVLLMGLMGFVRSGLREDWHIYGVLRDTSEWAFTPTHAEMGVKVVLISAIYMALLAFVFWLGDLARGRDAPSGWPDAEPGGAAGGRPDEPDVSSGTGV